MDLTSTGEGRALPVVTGLAAVTQDHLVLVLPVPTLLTRAVIFWPARCNYGGSDLVPQVTMVPGPILSLYLGSVCGRACPKAVPAHLGQSVPGLGLGPAQAQLLHSGSDGPTIEAGHGGGWGEIRGLPGRVQVQGLRQAFPIQLLGGGLLLINFAYLICWGIGRDLTVPIDNIALGLEGPSRHVVWDGVGLSFDVAVGCFTLQLPFRPPNFFQRPVNRVALRSLIDPGYKPDHQLAIPKYAGGTVQARPGFN